MMRCAALWLALGKAIGAAPLPALHAEAQGITVSGVSSGGYMAVQMHVAHSATVTGAGVIAGAPYYCAQGNLFYAMVNCNAARLVDAAADGGVPARANRSPREG